MQSRVDLHCHSSASDGLLEPAALVELAARVGLGAIALTDHDTTAGIPEAVAAGAELSLRVVGGVEISCNHGRREVHVLGLFIDHRNQRLEELLSASRNERDQAAVKVLERLASLGANLEMEEVRAFAEGPTLGRSHFARALVARGHVGSAEEAFSLYLGEGRPARVHRPRPSVQEACEAIHRAGGVAALAHPGSGQGLISQEAVLQMVWAGLDALEVHHPSHDQRTRARIEKWTRSMGLLISGGSDYHGHGQSASLGACFVGEEELAGLYDRAMLHRKRNPG